MPNEVIQRPDWGSGSSLERGHADDNLPALANVSVEAGGTIIGGHAGNAVAVVQTSLSPEEFQALDNALAGLPEAVKSAIRDELAVGPDNRASPVSDDVVSRFRSDPAGEVLAAKWLWRTPGKVAVLHQRIRRIAASLSLSDREALDAWAAGRTVPETVAIVMALAGER